MSYIYSFWSRSGAMRFYDEAERLGGQVKLVNTPKIAGPGCGLSVRCEQREVCERALSSSRTALRAAFEQNGDSYRPIYNSGN